MRTEKVIESSGYDVNYSINQLDDENYPRAEKKERPIETFPKLLAEDFF